MLRHDDSSEAAAPPAAQVRVTPQELAAAIARLEARQGENEGTIPLGDAVQELGLNATPEELLREIEAGRARQQERPPRTRGARLLRIGMSGLAAGALLLGGLFAVRTAPAPPPPVVTVTAPAVPQAAPIGVPDTLLVRQRDGKMVLLAEVPDGQPVLCLLEATENGARLADFTAANVHWTLVKHGGRAYLRGWIGDMSDTALRSSIVTVHPSADFIPTGLRPLPVTLALDALRLPAGLTNDTLISASRVVPDEHLKEKW